MLATSRNRRISTAAPAFGSTRTQENFRPPAAAANRWLAGCGRYDAQSADNGRKYALIDAGEAFDLVITRNVGEAGAMQQGGLRPVGAYFANLGPALNARIKEAVRDAYCSGSPDGPRSLTASAWAVHGKVP